MSESAPNLVMVVEIPKGSRNKYEVDHATGEIYLDRMLFTATRYPADYGFIPDTLAEDGDPLDALALVNEPTFPGCRVRLRPIGLFLMEDQGKPDHKVIGVPIGDPVWSEVKKLGDLPPHLLKEIEHFFSVYKDLELKVTATHGFRVLQETLGVIERSRAAYFAEHHPGSTGS
jgi:inorganic pyrophosphatase